MNIETLKVFRDLIDTGNFSKTAELNYISQSAVSQQIKKLELVMKSKLFSRTANKIALTPCGEKFYEGSRKIVMLYENLLVSVRQFSASKNTGEIRISAIYSVGTYLLQNYIRKFMEKFPGAGLSVEYRKFLQIYGDIASGRSDFGVLACPHRKMKDIAMLPLGAEKMVLITGVSDKFARKKTINLKELDGADFIFFDKFFPSRKHIDDFFRKHSVKVNFKMELDNIETIKTAVQSGMGVSLVPYSTIRDDERENKLHVATFSDVELSRPLYLIFNKNRKMSSAHKYFMEVLQGGERSQVVKAAR